MRYGIISDIHSNLEALDSVLNALAQERIDVYLSLGDVVGYGASPKECIKLLKSIKPAVLIAGNHEWGVIDKADAGYFNDLARKTVIWTKNILDKSELEYLKSFQLAYEDEKMALVHGTLNMPEEFYYIFDTRDAYVTISRMKSSLCFIGHTHIPGIFASSGGNVEYMKDSAMRIDYGRKYVINAGSVGQPRDGDPRASYAIYDDIEAALEIKRTGYDIKKAQDRILSSGLPAKFAYRLSEGR